LRRLEPESHRRFYCARCGRVVVLCKPCDRGNRYCGIECRSLMRRKRVREAGRRYQRTVRGRRANADRQRRFRERKSPEVTHQGPDPAAERGATPPRRCSALRFDPERPPQPVLPRQGATDRQLARASGARVAPKCHCCGLPCGLFTRYEFLTPRRRRSKIRLPRD